MMKTKTYTLIAAIGCLLLLTACGNTSRSRVASGAAIGAGSGALIGSLSGSAGTGALIGAGAGALGGVLVDEHARGSFDHKKKKKKK